MHLIDGEAVVLVFVGVEDEASRAGIGEHLECCEDDNYEVEQHLDWV